MKTSESIKSARKNAGLTQKELAEKIGTTQQNLAQYETGRRKPKIETLQKIANALNVDIPDLLTISEVTPLIKKEYGKKETISNMQDYLESLGYIVLREERIQTVKKGYINFDLSNDEQQMLEKYGYVRRQEFPYFIQKDNNYFRLTEKQFSDMEKEIDTAIEFQLWKYRVKNINQIPEYRKDSE